MQAPILNLAAYQFHPIENPAAHLSALKAQGDHLGIRGTLLLSPEGLNGFWAAPEAAAEAFLNLLRGLPGFESLEAKASWSVEQPFKRFKVKVKAEIIRMNHPTIAPWGGRAPAISHRRWPAGWTKATMTMGDLFSCSTPAMDSKSTTVALRGHRLADREVH